MSRGLAAIAATSNWTDVSIEFQPFEGNGRQDDLSDRVLAKAVASRIINVLRQQLLRGAMAASSRLVRIWALPVI